MNPALLLLSLACAVQAPARAVQVSASAVAVGRMEDLILDACRTEAVVSGPLASVRTVLGVRNGRQTPVQVRFSRPAGGEVVMLQARPRAGRPIDAPAGARELLLPSLDPGASLEIEVTETRTLRLDKDGWTLVLPAPRGLAIDFAPAQFQTTLRVCMPLPIRTIQSRFHGLDLQAEPQGVYRAAVKLTSAELAQQDATLTILTTTRDLEPGLLALGRGHHLLQLQPPESLPNSQRVPLELCVLFDTTVPGTPDERASREALLKRLLWSLGIGDRLALGVTEGGILPLSPPTGLTWGTIRDLLARPEGPIAPLAVLERLATLPRGTGHCRGLVVVTDGRGSQAQVLGQRLETLERQGWEVAVVASSSLASPSGLGKVAGDRLVHGIQDAEEVAGRFLDAGRLPALVDIQVDSSGAPGFSLVSTSYPVLKAGQPWLALGHQAGPATGELVLKGRIGDRTRSWRLPLAAPVLPLASALPTDLSTLVESPRIARPRPVPTMGRAHRHGPSRGKSEPFLCTIRSSQEGLPTAELWSLVEETLLSPAFQTRLAQGQHEDFTLFFTIDAQGRVPKVWFSSPLQDAVLEAEIRKAIRDLRFQGWCAVGETQVEVPVHTH